MIKLYYHKTDGGAEYLMDTFIKWEHNGKNGKEGTLNDKTKYVVRLDGDITKDAELRIMEIDEDKAERDYNYKKNPITDIENVIN